MYFFVCVCFNLLTGNCCQNCRTRSAVNVIGNGFKTGLNIELVTDSVSAD